MRNLTIQRFLGRYRFLSNFYPAIVSSGDLVCETVEHAYQASKTLDSRERRKIAAAPTAARAKALGRRVRLRDGWNAVRLAVMYDLLEQKFEEDTTLADLLIETGDAELIEGNSWGDTFWGFDGVGENWLGRLLMLRRSVLVRRVVA